MSLKANDVRWRERKDGPRGRLRPGRGAPGSSTASDYEAATKALREWYKSLPTTTLEGARALRPVDERGIWFPDNISSPNYRENLIYDWKGYARPTTAGGTRRPRWRSSTPTAA